MNGGFEADSAIGLGMWVDIGLQVDDSDILERLRWIVTGEIVIQWHEEYEGGLQCDSILLQHVQDVIEPSSQPHMRVLCPETEHWLIRIDLHLSTVVGRDERNLLDVGHLEKEDQMPRRFDDPFNVGIGMRCPLIA